MLRTGLSGKTGGRAGRIDATAGGDAVPYAGSALKAMPAVMRFFEKSRSEMKNAALFRENRKGLGCLPLGRDVVSAGNRFPLSPPNGMLKKPSAGRLEAGAPSDCRKSSKTAISYFEKRCLPKGLQFLAKWPAFCRGKRRFQGHVPD